MAAQIIPGKEIASKIKEYVKNEVDKLKEKGIFPKLVAVQVGENPASEVYVKQQKKNCEKVGISYELKQLPKDTDEEKLISFINSLNNDDSVTGIILQLPLPEGIDVRKVQS
ncbi:MAG: bifunctional 5,10-methylenetetrahydrofolate dehydrogenase/5,10-methenyltetrahydrofolate cyclohydrolase, partial [Candidatus Omnitrophota bacterium]